MELKVENLTKRYGGKTVLDGVSFALREGVTCLMAPSGAGKTTLLRLLLGLEKADGGQITGLAGRRISAVFQEDRLLPGLDAAGNLRFALGADYDGGKAAELLEGLGLGDAGGKAVRDYSGGMRRRLALARALLFPCDILLLDEPFTGLDPENRRRAAACVRRHGAGKIVFVVTHEASDAEALEAEILRLYGGRPTGGCRGSPAAWPDGIRAGASARGGWATPLSGRGEPPTKVSGLREDILFKSKEYPLALPKKDSRGDFVFPPGTPLKRPKERPAGLSFGILSGVDGGFVTGDVGTGGRKSKAGCFAPIQGILPCGGRG